MTTNPRPLSSRFAALALGGLFLAAFGLYLRTLSPAFHPDDSAETITAAATLGPQHPPGYPLHTLLGRLAVLALPGPPPFAVNALAALCGAVAAVLAACAAYALAREVASPGASRKALAVAALGVGALVAVNADVWFQATIAKGGIYTLNLALEMGLLLLAAATAHAWGAVPGEAVLGKAETALRSRWIAAAGLCFGLGLGDHWPSMLSLAPSAAALIALGLFLRRSRGAGGHPGAAFAWAGLAALVGASTYLLLPLRAVQGTALAWGDPRSLGGLWWIFERGQYAPVEAGKTLTGFGGLLTHALGRIVRAWTWFGLVPVILGWGLFFWRRPVLAGALALAPLSLVCAVALKSNPPPDSLFVVDPYLLPAQAFLGLGLVAWVGLPWAAGYGRCVRFFHRRFHRTGGFARGARFSLGLVLRAAPLLPLAGACALAAWNGAGCDHSRDFLGWDYARNLLLSAPKGAVIACDGDANVAGPLYARFAQRRRRDVCLIPAVLIDYPWERQAALRQAPDLKLPPFESGPKADFEWMVQAQPERPQAWTFGFHDAFVDPSTLTLHGLVALKRPAGGKLSPEDVRRGDLWPAFALRGVYPPYAPAVDDITRRLVLENYAVACYWTGAQGEVSGADDVGRIGSVRLGLLKPGWAEPWIHAGDMAWGQGDQSGAVGYWKRAAAEQPDDAKTAFLAAKGLAKAWEIREAFVYARKALALDPQRTDVPSLIKQLDLTPEKPLDAEDHAIGISAGQAGDRLAAQGKFAEATRAYDRALAHGYLCVALLANRGLSFGRQQRGFEASESFRLALDLDPGDPQLMRWYGYFLCTGSRFEEGSTWLDKAAALLPEDAEVQKIASEARRRVKEGAFETGAKYPNNPS
jgi:tetratricopeptide (TPR) repeat protein